MLNPVKSFPITAALLSITDAAPGPTAVASPVNEVIQLPAGCLLLNVNQSTLDRYPSKLLLDCCIEMSGLTPPVENKGVVADTDETPVASVQDLSADKL